MRLLRRLRRLHKPKQVQPTLDTLSVTVKRGDFITYTSKVTHVGGFNHRKFNHATYAFRSGPAIYVHDLDEPESDVRQISMDDITCIRRLGGCL